MSGSLHRGRMRVEHARLAESAGGSEANRDAVSGSVLQSIQFGASVDQP
jgi:hypothetical protein